MANYIGNKFGQADHDKLADYQKRVDPNDKQAQVLLEEMRAHIKKLEDMRKHEDPRLSFSTPEFKEAQRLFTNSFKVDSDGKPWPLDEEGKPILKS